MTAVNVEIIRWVDDDQPGFVECRLIDVSGRDWRFVDKLPVFTAANLSRKSAYPQPGIIACEVEKTWSDEVGRELCLINTDRPWGVESTSSETRFHVLSTQLCEY